MLKYDPNTSFQQAIYRASCGPQADRKEIQIRG